MATTTAPAALARIFTRVNPYLKTVENGGVVGDAKHGSGYHLSRNALIARGLKSDYSVLCPADKRGSGTYAAAIDLTFGSLSELVTVTKRLRAACEAKDPRVEPLREHIGTLDGRNVCGYNRVATGSGSRSRVGWTASDFSDSSHLWHAHLSVLRAYVTDENMMTGLAEIVAGLAAGALGWHEDGKLPPPATLPPVVSVPATTVKVSLKALVAAFKADPKRPQGGTTPGSDDDVKAVEWALYKAGLLDKKYAEDGSAGSLTVEAYAAFQRSLGYSGDDADGIPGEASLKALGKKYGFEVVA